CFVSRSAHIVPDSAPFAGAPVTPSRPLAPHGGRGGTGAARQVGDRTTPITPRSARGWHTRPVTTRWRRPYSPGPGRWVALAWGGAVDRGGLGGFRAGFVRVEHGARAGAVGVRHHPSRAGPARGLDHLFLPDPAHGRVRERPRRTGARPARYPDRVLVRGRT